MIDFNIDKDEKLENITIVINPLTPLHISNSLGGRYNISSIIPSNNKIYGLLENILGIHISDDIRKEIKKSIKSKNKNYSSNTRSYMPVIDDFVKILDVRLCDSEYEKFDDLCKNLNNRADKSHYQGVTNVDISFANSDRKDHSNISIKNRLHSKFPRFYSGVIKKQYINFKKGYYEIDLELNTYFKSLILDTISESSSGIVGAYMGNSESLVNISLKK